MNVIAYRMAGHLICAPCFDDDYLLDEGGTARGWLTRGDVRGVQPVHGDDPDAATPCAGCARPLNARPGARDLFSLGSIGATPASLDLLHAHGIHAGTLLGRHVAGDWGDVDPEAHVHNDLAVRTGARILSTYTLAPRATVWIITDVANDGGERATTTLLLPDDY